MRIMCGDDLFPREQISEEPTKLPSMRTLTISYEHAKRISYLSYATQKRLKQRLCALYEYVLDDMFEKRQPRKKEYYDDGEFTED